MKARNTIINDLIISDDVEPTESYAGVGDDNIVSNVNDSYKIDLNLARKGIKQKSKKSSRKGGKYEPELSARKTEMRIPIQETISKNYKYSNEIKTCAATKDKEIPSLPELRERFVAIEKDLPPEKVHSINEQIEKLTSKKHKITLAEKIRKMKDVKDKGNQNWAKFKSEVEFVRKAEERNLDHLTNNYFKNEDMLNDVVQDCLDFSKENVNVAPLASAIEHETSISNASDEEGSMSIEEPTNEFIDFNLTIKPAIKRLTPVPIDADSALELKQLLFNSPNRNWGSEWHKQTFQLRLDSTEVPFGINQKYKGPDNIMALVQAEILVEYLFLCNATKNRMSNIKRNSQLILVGALSRIISRCYNFDENDSLFKLYLLDPNLKGRTLSFIKEDGLTECLTILSIESEDSLRQCLTHYIDQFTNDDCPGLILLVLSCLATYGLSRCRRELRSEKIRLISPYGEAKSELFFLMLSGSFTDHVFNDVVVDINQNSLSTVTIRGISRRSTVGYLTLKTHCSLCAQVGTYLKTPKYPVWIAEWKAGHYCVLFCENRSLTSDWKTEIHFNLKIYSPGFNVDNLIVLRVDSTRSSSVRHQYEIEEKNRVMEAAKKEKDVLEHRLQSMSPNALYLLLEGKSIDAYVKDAVVMSSFDAHGGGSLEELDDYSYLDLIIHTKWQTSTLEVEQPQNGTCIFPFFGPSL